MRDQDKSQEQLLREVEALRRQVASLEDVDAERKRAEQESAKVRGLLQATIDSLPFDFFALGPDGRYVLQNATSREHWGDATGKRPEEVCADKDSLAVWLDNNRRAFGGEQIDEEVTLTVRGAKRFYRNVIVPIRGQGITYGILGMNLDITERKRAEEALQKARDELERRVAERTAELAKANEQLWRMLQASDHERRIISYDIHDGLAQYLAAAGMQFQSYEALRENSPDEAKKAYATAVELVRQAHAESRRLISEVRPPVIDEIGLETAISHLVHEQRRHGGPKIEFQSDVQFEKLPPILENVLYRIVQEALTNACKHSKSRKVTVVMDQEGEEVRLEVRDWGIGFNPESVEKGHFGLEGIRQRARLLGGRLAIQSTPGSGTIVQVVVPILEKQNEEWAEFGPI